MTTTTETRPAWDFSAILEFAHTFTPSATADGSANLPSPQPSPAAPRDDGGCSQERVIDNLEATEGPLGDFSKVWQFLGTPKNLPPSTLPIPLKDDYASDGAVTHRQWRTASISSSGSFSGPHVAESGVQQPAQRTKTQKKRDSRKAKKAREAEAAAVRAMVSESEADSCVKNTPTPAARASTHVNPAVRNTPALQIPPPEVKAKAPTISTHASSAIAAVNRLQNTAIPIKTASSVVNGKPLALKNTKQSLSTPVRANISTHRFTPSSLPPPIAVQHASAANTQVLTPKSTALTPKTPRSQPIIQPFIIRSGIAREHALLLKLLRNFFDENDPASKYLVAPRELLGQTDNSNGVHVFVDASNIFIGFMQQLKAARRIHVKARVDVPNLSFDGLALLMERRRPVARRVLVGSTPHLPAFDQAKDVGYQCMILEKVLKARELTDRQIFFRELDKAKAKNRYGRKTVLPQAPRLNPNDGDSGGNSETREPQFDPPRMIEQGVDEILHLQMMTSVLDFEPSTMILATGDAAAAEYSDGFKAHLERALSKGWKVELITWSKNISSAYKASHWLAKWGGRFKIIYLDDYAEELLDVEGQVEIQQV